MNPVSRYTRIVLLALVLVPAGLYPQIIQVRQDGTGDAVTIQGGIDLSQDGDSVLVWPGLYQENVKIYSKNITLASLVLTTGCPSYRDSTIIDGNFTGSGIKIGECQEGVTICGFTLQHGSGSYHGYMSGGGILSDVAKLSIKECMIRDNRVTGIGGGIYCRNTELFLSGVTICHNYAYIWAGGIELLSSPVEFDPVDLCNLYLNYASKGTEIYKQGGDGDTVRMVVDTFTVASPDYYYLYSDQLSGFPRNDILYDIQTPMIETVNQDLYVSPWGDNANSGLDPSEPLKQISFALLKMESDSITPDTIHLAPGNYSLTEGQQFPLGLKAYVSIKGAGKDSTILDGDNDVNLIKGNPYADHYQISDLTVFNGNGDTNSYHNYGAFDILYNRHSTFSNLKFISNTGHVCSGGAIHNSNNFTISNTEFSGNFGGQALRMSHSQAYLIFYDTARIYNCHFFDNQPEYNDPEEGFGGGLSFLGDSEFPDLMTGYVYNSLFHDNFTKEYPFGAGSNSIGIGFQSKVNVVNCSFGYNNSENADGANIGVTYDSDMKVYNSIMYGNYPAEFYMYAFDGDDCSLSIYNSLVEGGEENIRILSPWNYLYYDETNIDTDPVWDTAGLWPYSLLEGSPCIDAGTLDLPLDIELPPTDIAGNPRVYGSSVDMGAYEYGPWVKIPDLSDYPPEKAPSSLAVSPNPFHCQTEIYYRTEKAGRLTIKLFDLKGIYLATLLDCSSYPGQGIFSWNTVMNKTGSLSPGVYLLCLSLNDMSQESIKIVIE